MLARLCGLGRWRDGRRRLQRQVLHVGWFEEIAMSDGEVEELVADALLHAVVRYGGYGEARVSDMLRHCL